MEKQIIQMTACAGLLVLTASCSASYVQTRTAGPAVPTLAVDSTRADVATVSPGLQATTAGISAGQAPLCAATATCAALDAEQIPLGCVKKVPYTNVLVPRGTTFEVLDQSGDFTCIDSGIVLNDQEVLTCHGTQLFTFQLKLTNAACAGTTLDTSTGQCQDGYGYDSTARCCAAISDSSAGSATVAINLGACPLPSGP